MSYCNLPALAKLYNCPLPSLNVRLMFAVVDSQDHTVAEGLMYTAAWNASMLQSQVGCYALYGSESLILAVIGLD